MYVCACVCTCVDVDVCVCVCTCGIHVCEGVCMRKLARLLVIEKTTCFNGGMIEKTTCFNGGPHLDRSETRSAGPFESTAVIRVVRLGLIVLLVL